jgi:non-specific serine/threonine protein kinase
MEDGSLVTILFADLVGWTWLFDRCGDQAADVVRREHFTVLRSVACEQGGSVVKSTGAGLMVAFSSAVAAVRCAVDMQRASEAAGLELRVGLDSGEPMPEGEDPYGTAVMIASRLCESAGAREIVAADVVRRIAGPRLAYPIEPIGAIQLPRFPGRVAVSRVRWREAIRKPARPASAMAARQPDSSRTAERESAAEHNVPAPLTSIIGRARELEVVGETLRRTRLVTLIGPGGVGKTRLAVELARGQIGRRADGVWLVDLTAGPATGPGPAAEVARTLDVGGGSAAVPIESLRRYLANRDVLLVLDNCEHVVAECAELTAGLLGSCGGVRVLATSREPLGVSGETVSRLAPLAAVDAHRLFVDRARQRQPEFIPSADEDVTIARLCARLDHLPLAIELAAARVGFMSPAEILSGLEARLDTLGGGSRLSPPRHRTVRATVEWSYDLLDRTEQRAFRSLAVFVAGFNAGAALAVAPGLTLEMFARLVDKSVIVVRVSPSGRTRYRLLETVREYAYELLAEAGELNAARERHLRHWSPPADVAHEGWLFISAESLMNEFEDDYENIRAALEWAAVSDPCGGMRLLAAMRDLFFMLGQADGRRLAQLLLARCPTRDRTRAVVLVAAGVLAMLTVDVSAANASHREARELGAELGERELEGHAVFFLGLTATLGGAIGPARAHLEASRKLHHEADHRVGEACSIAALGLTYAMTDETARARELVEHALAMQVAEGFRWGQGQAHLYLGIIADSAGIDPRLTASHFRQAVDCLHPYRDVTLLPVALVGQAGVLARRDPARAHRVAAAAWAMRARVGGAFAPFYRERAERVRAACEAALGTDAERAWAEGERLGVDDAIALAFGASRPRPSAPGGLSARELEIVGLVAAGRSNKAIAAHLHISVRTVESHVRHALAKAGLENRTQLATWARERIQ